MSRVTASPRTASTFHLEEQHQREMVRMHEMWQATKAELRTKNQELDEIRTREVHGNLRTKRENEATVSQMHALVLEMRYKLRFTELKLAGSREECANLAAKLEAQQRDFASVRAEAEAQRELQHRQVSTSASSMG